MMQRRCSIMVVNASSLASSITCARFTQTRKLAAAIGIVISVFAPYALAASPVVDYPSKPIRLLVGFPPGGGVDIAARSLANEIQKTLGQTIVVDNKPGAGGGLAADLAARSPADGYTLLMGNTGSLAINPSLYAKLPYDPLRDFIPVASVSSTPLLFLAHPSSAAKTLPDVVNAAKASPGKLNYGSAGSGGITHLAIELLRMQSGLNMVHVPYRGSAPAVTDLIAGQLDLLVEGLPLATPLIQSNKVRALAITDTKRSALLPDVPTVDEAGMPGLKMTAWYGLVAPSGTPAPIVDKLNKAINVALKNPEFIQKLAQQGSEPASGTPAQFGDFLRQESARWATAVKASGAKVE